MSSFGFSATDILAAIELIAKVAQAMRATNGAASEYQDVLRELENLQAILAHLAELQPPDEDRAHFNAIRGVALTCRPTILEFEQKLKRFEEGLGHGGGGGGMWRKQGTMGARKGSTLGEGMKDGVKRVGSAARKAQWAVWMEKDVKTFRSVIQAKVLSISLLMGTQNMRAIGRIEERGKQAHNMLLSKVAEIQAMQTQTHETILQDTQTQTELVRKVDALAIQQRQSNSHLGSLGYLKDAVELLLSRIGNMPAEILSLLKNSLQLNMRTYTLLLSLHETVVRTPSLLLSDNILLEDALGRIKSLPYAYFQHWEYFETMLRVEFKDMPGASYIKRGQFRIQNARGKLVLPSRWRQDVLPGEKLTMAVVVRDYNKGKRKPDEQCVRCGGRCDIRLDGQKHGTGEVRVAVCPDCGWEGTYATPPAVQQIELLPDDPEYVLHQQYNAAQSTPSQSFQAPPLSPSSPSSTSLSPVPHTLFATSSVSSDLTSIKRLHLPFPAMVVPAPLKPAESRGETTLTMAAKSGDLPTLLSLLTAGVDPDIPGGWFGNALQTASFHGHDDIVSLLLSFGATLNPPSSTPATAGPGTGFFGCALSAAAARGHHSTVRLLLDRGANPNLRGGEYGFPLQGGANSGNREVVKALLDAGADVHASGAGAFDNSLSAGAFSGNVDVVQLLLAHRADVNKFGGSLGTPFLAAAAGAGVQMLKILLDAGAEVNTKGGTYHCAFQALASNDRPGDRMAMARLLLQSGAEVNAVGGLLETPLIAASLRGRKELVKFLLEAGADKEIVSRGRTALSVAREYGRPDVVRLLGGEVVEV